MRRSDRTVADLIRRGMSRVVVAVIFADGGLKRGEGGRGVEDREREREKGGDVCGTVGGWGK